MHLLRHNTKLAPYTISDLSSKFCLPEPLGQWQICRARGFFNNTGNVTDGGHQARRAQSWSRQ